jgi:hypothetical protein
MWDGGLQDSFTGLFHNDARLEIDEGLEPG